MIHIAEGKENITLTYGNKMLPLEGITKTGDAKLVYDITQGENVLYVSTVGTVIPQEIGIATISINMPKTANYKKAETKTITVTVNKAGCPESAVRSIDVNNMLKTVAEVELPYNWEWDSEDAKKALLPGKTLEATANYVGNDKGYYNTTSVEVTLKRAECVSSDILYTGVEEKAPSCTSEGKGHKECTICKEVLESDIAVPAIKHKMSKVSEKKATCSTNGYKEHWQCSECKKQFSDEAGNNEVAAISLLLPMGTHTGGVADCTKKAICSTCQQEYGEIDKNKHGETEVKNAKEATCAEKGYTGDVCCKACGEKVSSGEEKETLSHKLTKVEGQEATCEKEGKKSHYSCEKCKKLFSDEQGSEEISVDIAIIPATGHTGGHGNCKEKPVCTICHKAYGKADKTKHVNEREIRNIKEATCEEKGYTGDVCCKGCGEIISKGKATAKSKHTWDKGIITKETTGYIKTYTCGVCHTTKTEKVVTPGTLEKVTTPEIPKTEATPTPTAVPTKIPSKVEIPAAGTVVTDKNTKVKYKILVSHPKNGTVEYVGALNKKSTKANVPATVKINGITYKVVSIGKNAFKNHKYIKKITIGKNVKTIGANAFYGCKKLKNVFMGKNITTIGNKAFYKCTALTKITIPSKVKKIGKQSFTGCKNLKTITIKTTKLTNKNVGSKAFSGVNKKATVKVPKSKVKTYQKLLKSKGISKTVNVKK